MFRQIAPLIALSMPTLASAQTDISGTLLSIFSSVNSVFSSVAIIIGIGLLAGAFIQYKEHKRNPLQVPISRPIVVFILGVVLIAIPLLGEMTQGGGIVNNV